MTREQILKAAEIVVDLDQGSIVDLREIGSEGCVLRTVVPGPLRGPGSWLVARNGDAQSSEGEWR